MKTKRPLVTKAWDYSDTSNDRTVGKKAVLNLFLNRRQDIGVSYQDGPVSDLYYPVFKTHAQEEEEEQELGGMLAAYVYWQVYFGNVLPPSANPIMAILENSAGQQFSYLIEGPEATYIGQGDLHDTRYNDLEIATGMGAFLGQEQNTDELEEGQCTYRVRVFPTKEMEDAYMTTTPLVFTIILCSTFLLTSLVFVVYDIVVEKRQKKVRGATTCPWGR
jgi:hypothetical protein